MRKLQDLGDSIAMAAVTRQSPAGAALVACTLDIVEEASTAGGVAGADAAEVVVAGLDSGKCRAAAANAGVTDDLDQLRSETKLVQVAADNVRTGWASSLALPDGADLLVP